MVLQHMANTGQALSEIRETLPQYAISKNKVSVDGLDVDALLEKLAARYADRLLLLDAGRAVASGRAQDVVTRERIEHVRLERLVGGEHHLAVELEAGLRQPAHARAGADDDGLLRLVGLLLAVGTGHGHFCLVAQGRSLYDRFRGRLMWPIRDTSGDTIGFGARRIFDDDRIEAKYLNTPETAIYKKSHVLYGIDLARREIAKSSQAVIVEGYTDVMACHLAGVKTAVATCGTAFGEDHARVVRRLLQDHDEFRGEVIFTFDGDAAGQKAALKAFEGEQAFSAQTYIAIAPEGMDPCELRIKEGDAAVRELIATRRPLYRFVLENVPTGTNIPLVIQVGKWRRELNIGPVSACTDTAVPDQTLRLLSGGESLRDVDFPYRRLFTAKEVTQLELTEGEWDAMLEGLALAIELAAGRAGSHGVAATADRWVPARADTPGGRVLRGRGRRRRTGCRCLRWAAT